MSNLIDKTYFIDEVFIPNLNSSNTMISDAIVADLTVAIARYEKEYLIKLLGEDLYDDFIAGLKVLPVPDSKWTDLKNKLVDSTNKLSPISNYIYFQFVRRHPNLLNNKDGEGKTLIPSADLLSLVFNNMVDDTMVIYYWINYNIDIYDNMKSYLDEDFNKVNSLNL